MDSKVGKTLLILVTAIAVYYFYNLMSDTSQMNDDPVAAETEGEQLIPKHFLSFLENFEGDSLYQSEHIVFPLSGIAVNDSSQNEHFTWKSSDWKTHRKFDDMGGTFVREYTILGTIIEERITATGYNFDMVRRFALMDDEYFLIYYKSMGPSL